MRALWIDKDGLRPYRREDLARLFKWALFERGGQLVLAAMPYDAGWLFHMEAVAQAALQSGWCDAKAAEKFLQRTGNLFHEAGIRVLGGGTRFEDGRIRNYSYRFGAVPEKRLAEVHAALHLA
jgi:hypothetical protein